jgi:nucleotide-binding universal stress UspA family protein
VVHVLEERHYRTLYPDGYVDLSGLRQRLIDDATTQLATVARRCQQAQIEVSTAMLSGRPARAILDEATNRDVDLIVMGTHGRTGVTHLVVGSVTEQVVRTAPCPVLTIRETARRAEVPAAGREATRQPLAAMTT